MRTQTSFKSVMLRTHARIANLLSRDQVQRLAECPDLESFLEALKETPYGEITLEEGVNPSIQLERAFNQKFAERIAEIVKLTPGARGEFLHTYFHLRFEVLNLKRILRGIFNNWEPEEIADSLIPIEPITVKDYQPLTRCKSLEEAVGLLEDTPYKALRGELERVRQVEALWPLEHMLNQIYSKRVLALTASLPKSDQRMVNALVRYENDVENILTALKYRGKEVEDFEELFPVTYGVSLETLTTVAKASDIESAINLLEEPYKTVLDPLRTGDVAMVRAMLRRGKCDVASRAKAMDQFGFNVILAFLVYSEAEKDNLVGLAWGKAQGLPPENLLKYIVLPRG